MSNRSLIEINHDFAHVIDKDDDFQCALLDYLRSASPDNAKRLERYGIRVFGMRHHSDGFKIEWGSVTVSEGGSWITGSPWMTGP